MRNAVIFDIDGTLADCEHRRHHVTNGNKNWTAFFSELHLDKPKPNVIKFAQTIYYNDDYGHELIIVTGRGEEYRDVTQKWLNDNAIYYTSLLMRPLNDSRPDTEIKLEIYDKIKPNFNIILVIEDRTSLVKMWRSLGLECWQVADGDF